MIRRALLSLVAVPFAIACGSSASEDIGSSTASGPRTMKGSIALTAYTVDNPVVIARSSQGVAYVAPVARDGRFSLVLPSTEHYRVMLASTRADGTYRAVSELRWGAEQAAWGSFSGTNPTLDLGVVRPAGTTAQGVRTASKGSGSTGEADSVASSDPTSSSSDATDDASGSEPEACYKPGKADLPYDAEPGVGDTWKLLDAFLEKGAPPKAVLDVTMEGTSWRLDELKSGAAFTITQADCDHEGNRSTGRDRIFVTWENADGSKETDHLDMRYCNGGGGGGGGATTAAATGECKGDEGSACGDAATTKSECDGGSLKPEEGAALPLPSCDDSGGAGAGSDGTTPAGSSGSSAAVDADGSGVSPGSSDAPSLAAAGGGAAAGTAGGVSDAGGACVTSANCGANLACFGSVCVSSVR